MSNPIDVSAAGAFTDATGNPADTVTIFDTTLRDGEQSPGISLDAREKVEIAEQLARLQVDIIEAGFAAASAGDLDAVKAVAETVGNEDRLDARGETVRKAPVIASLARCVPGDIEAAAKALAPAARGRIHVFISSSEIQMRAMLKSSNEQVIASAVAGIQQAKSHTDDVEFSPQDATRTEWSFLVELVTAAVEAGATTINIPDTVGYALPHDFGQWMVRLKQEIPSIDAKGVVLSVHCHNDLGLAVANSLEAIRNGARQVEVAVNGLGERAGNCSLEEVVMAIRTRQDLLRLDHGVNTPELARTSQLVSSLTGYSVQKNKAIVGANAFAHESGIHQHGVLQDRLTYEIMRTEDVGVSGSSIIMGKHSGRHAFKQALEQLSIELDDAEVDVAFAAFKQVADKKGELTLEDVRAIVMDHSGAAADVEGHELASFSCANTPDTLPTATVTIRPAGGGEYVTATATGDGMVDAACTATREAIGRDDVKLTVFNVGAVTEGIDALATVTITIEVVGGTFTGRGVATDVVEASARAFLDAINRSDRLTKRDGEFKV
ncbi:MAG: 2-isopropylmalate synthase [Nitriliruptoraceae bacterium]|jgi:2-isopropylmalate synthase